MLSSVRAQLTPYLMSAARAWIRYSPTNKGKRWLWDRFYWRSRVFACKTRFGMHFTGDTRDLIQRYIYYFGVWEPNATRWLCSKLKPGDCFIDVGANVG